MAIIQALSFRERDMYQNKIFSDFSTKTYFKGTQKNRLNEAILLSSQSYV